MLRANICLGYPIPKAGREGESSGGGDLLGLTLLIRVGPLGSEGYSNGDLER